MNAAVLLRQKVLDLAIRGMLTKREKGDDSIRKILDQVSFEKAERIAKKRNRKEKLLPPVSQEERPFEVPFEWEWRRLGEVLLPTETKLPVGKWFDYIDIDAIDNHQNVIVRAKHLETRDAPSRASRGVQFGDVLFSVVRPYLRNIVLVGKEFSHCIASTGFHVCRPSAALDSRFLFDVMLSDYVVDGLNAFMKGDNSPSINVDHIVNFPIPIPPLAEQKRIVERIDELFAAIDQYSTAMEKISNAANLMEQKVLDLAIRGKLTKREKGDGSAAKIIDEIAADKAKRIAKKLIRKEKPLPPIEPDDEPFDIPQGWVWCRFGELCAYGQCDSVSFAELPKNTWALDLEEIEKDTGRLIERKLVKDKQATSGKHLFKKGMLLYSKLRTYLNKVLIADQDGVCTSEIIPIDFHGFVDAAYARIVLMSPYFLSYTASKDYGVKMPRVSTDDMRMAAFPLPPLAEQKRIVERVDAILSECRKIQR